MIEKGMIEAHLKEVLRDTGIFQVELRVDKSNRICIHVDRMEGITIEDCAHISRALEGRLNREREDFSLEVSSPGLDAPFRVPEQYRKNVGRKVSVRCHDGSSVTGILKGSDAVGIRLEVPSGKRGRQPEDRELKFEEIASTRLRIDF